MVKLHTTKLVNALNKTDWSKIPKQILINAKAIGDEVHKIIENDIKYDIILDGTSIAVDNCLYGWEDFKKKNPKLKMEAECSVSKQYTLKDGETFMLYGTPDIVSDDGIIEIKTTSSTSIFHTYQVWVYQWMTNNTDKQGKILYLDKKWKENYKTTPVTFDMKRLSNVIEKSVAELKREGKWY